MRVPNAAGFFLTSLVKTLITLQPTNSVSLLHRDFQILIKQNFV